MRRAKTPPLTLAGEAPNTMRGAWLLQAGHLVLAKQPGVDALSGTIIVAAEGDLLWNASNQINAGPQGPALGFGQRGASLNLNGFSDRIDRLTLAARRRCSPADPSAAC